MYREHFGLQDNPFSISPDPHYLYLSGSHREAMAHLLFALRGDGCFVLLTGEVGTGKTLVCRCLLEQLSEDVQVALVLNPRLEVSELLATICDELGIAYPQTGTGTKGYVDALNRFLLDAHGRGLTTVLIIDEAQNLSAAVLEQLRLLTNLETNRRKLLQIILIGQPELRSLLQRDDLRQLAQRITARYHLGPLGRSDLRPYLSHRLEVAGVKRPLFTAGALRRLFALSSGVPRLVNTLCDRALLGAYARGRHRVNAALVNAAGRELAVGRPRSRWAFALFVIMALAIPVAGWWWQGLDGRLQPPAGTVTDTSRTNSASAQPELAEMAAESTGTDDDAWFDGVDPAREDLQEAWSVLLNLWGNPLSEAGEACRPGPKSGYACLRSSATLANLLALDRPAILPLHRSDGEEFYGVLAAVRGSEVVLALGNRVGMLPAERLQKMWLGEFLLLWQPPPGVAGVVGPGSQGPAVSWLDRTLSLLGIPGGGSRGETQTFGPALAERVKQFQVRNGVQPDGIAGPQTLILLTNALAAPGPRLGDRFTEP